MPRIDGYRSPTPPAPLGGDFLTGWIAAQSRVTEWTLDEVAAYVLAYMAAHANVNWRNVSGTYTCVDADFNRPGTTDLVGINATATALVQIPNNILIVGGTLLVRKGGAGGAGVNDVTLVGLSPVVIDEPSGFTKVTTQFMTMSAIYMAANHYTLEGAQA